MAGSAISSRPPGRMSLTLTAGERLIASQSAQGLAADQVTVPVVDLTTAPAMARGERDPILRVDVTERADVGALANLHTGVHQHPRAGLCRRRRQHKCDDRGGSRCEHAQPSSAHSGLRSSCAKVVQRTGELRIAIPEEPNRQPSPTNAHRTRTPRRYTPVFIKHWWPEPFGPGHHQRLPYGIVRTCPG